MSLGRTIKAVHDILRKDSGIDGDAQRIGQLAWMLFLKIVDDREREKERTRERYRSPIPEELRWRSWAANEKRLTGDGLLVFINAVLFPELKSLTSTEPLAAVVRSVFEDAYNYMKSGHLLRRALDKLDEIDFLREEDRQEMVGVYEQSLSDLRSAGNAGEYYTPRAVIEFVVDRVDPKLGETILDPACGTGGFLVSAIEHLRTKYRKTAKDERKIQASIAGIEKKSLPHLLCVTNLLLHGIDALEQIRRANALEKLIGQHGNKDKFDVILIDPPLGGIEEDGTEDNFPAAFRTRQTADLFLYLVMTILRDGGRAAIVLPDGALFGEGVKTRLKERLLQECNLHTIVRLPRGVLSPYTAIKTNLLFFEKGKPTKEIWYYEHPLPPGYKSYSKTKPVLAEEFEPERRWWSKRRETSQAWKVSIDQIRARGYNLDVPKPVAGTPQAPTRLLALKLQSFRGLEHLDLALPHDGPAVLIGVNGAGKSSVLDAVAMFLSSFTTVATGSPARQAEVQLTSSDIRVGDGSATVSASFRVGDDEPLWELRASRVRGAGPLEKILVEQAEALREHLYHSEGLNVPVLCSYPASRGLDGAGGSGKRPALLARQLEAYEHAFGHRPGPFQDFLRWFREEEDVENELRLRQDPEYRNARLQVIRRALQLFLGRLGAGNFSDLRMERFSAEDAPKGVTKSAELVLEKNDVLLRVEQLSEGEKNTILLIADLARRFAVANPTREDPLQGEGIVLIDEIELHLHPSWQRGFLPALGVTFPKCQFIVSTHSPQVLSQIDKDHVFILEGFMLVRVTPHTYGHDTNSILGEVMGVPERPKDIEEKIRHASILVDEERIDEARAALDELASILGEHDNALVRLRTLMAFLGDSAEP